MNLPFRYAQAVEPIVRHGLREGSVPGANLTHVLREVAIMGALVGAGLPAQEAIRQVEAVERQLLGWQPGEVVEYGPMGGAGYMKPPGMGFGKQPGMGKPPGMGFGKPPGMMPGMGGKGGKMPGMMPGMGGKGSKMPGMMPGMGGMSQDAGELQ